MNQSSPFQLSPGDDPEMARASELARQSFRYYWRELTWEYRRVVGALGVSVVKIAFSDRPGPDGIAQPPEHMWLNEVMFDGAMVTATLMDAPNWVRSVRQGQQVRVPLHQIGDWMYSRNGQAYGGFTVNLIRSRMSRRERAQHDEAWGLNFGDPNDIQLVPDWSAEAAAQTKSGLFGRKKRSTPNGPAPSSGATGPDLSAEHPMALNMAVKYDEQCEKDPAGVLQYTDQRGFTPLHDMALAGSTACVEVFLNHGADPRVLTGNGWTAAQLAHALGWADVVALLQQHGG